MSISGNLVGSYSQLGKTFIIEDGDGNEITAVVVGQETVFTATDNDVREGYVYAGDGGVSIGTKNIPAYRTYTGQEIIFPGDKFIISGLSVYDLFDYTKLQCVISKFNTNFEDSVATDKISLNNQVYGVNSTASLSSVTKNFSEKFIDLNMTNDSEDIYIVHSFLYREEI